MRCTVVTNSGTALRRDGRGRPSVREWEWADVAQLVEHSLGKGEVTSSILVIGSRDWFESARARLNADG